jgi:glycyl-tRNA synthetase beta chain
MRHLASLRPAVDEFFDRILVNDPDPELRRARLGLLCGIRDALGVIRIIVENKLELSLLQMFRFAHGGVPSLKPTPSTADLDLLAFFHDRLKVMLREQGARHDLVDAVITPRSDDILRIVQRVEALSALLDTEDGQNLLTGYRRAVNILTIEEKKDQRTFGGDFVKVTAGVPEEQALYDALRTADVAVHKAIDADDYRAAMAELAKLRAPVDAFFEAVLVNDPDPALRANRLNLLAKLRDTMHLVADFSKIAG